MPTAGWEDCSGEAGPGRVTAVVPRTVRPDSSEFSSDRFRALCYGIG
jgi:hypothetical protein